MEKSILITFFIATLMVYQTLAQDKEISPISLDSYADVPTATAYDHELLRHMTLKRIKFLLDCDDKLSSKCGIEMTKGFYNNKPVSEECCENILKIGRDCHVGLMNLALATYELKDLAYEILPRSKQMWNTCVRTTAARIGAPLAFET
ncbi:Protein DOWN-REGULATED IN DIF1 11 [Cardamine amara subsp. amara]|uniref:Protein DOWN-REGULATED IN DIF1 11 n=1 Tax=Cardamine amara subsp. amara TaxID=228776 RepID=A0ABD0ZMS0_CARAN